MAISYAILIFLLGTTSASPFPPIGKIDFYGAQRIHE
jgi:hypothetical protein